MIKRDSAYRIMYSSSRQYAIHIIVKGKDMCIKDGMTCKQYVCRSGYPGRHDTYIYIIYRKEVNK